MVPVVGEFAADRSSLYSYVLAAQGLAVFVYDKRDTVTAAGEDTIIAGEGCGTPMELAMGSARNNGRSVGAVEQDLCPQAEREQCDWPGEHQSEDEKVELVDDRAQIPCPDQAAPRIMFVDGAPQESRDQHRSKAAQERRGRNDRAEPRPMDRADSRRSSHWCRFTRGGDAIGEKGHRSSDHQQDGQRPQIAVEEHAVLSKTYQDDPPQHHRTHDCPDHYRNAAPHICGIPSDIGAFGQCRLRDRPSVVKRSGSVKRKSAPMMRPAACRAAPHLASGGSPQTYPHQEPRLAPAYPWAGRDIEIKRS